MEIRDTRPYRSPPRDAKGKPEEPGPAGPWRDHGSDEKRVSLGCVFQRRRYFGLIMKWTTEDGRDKEELN
jgi:hypothetical protein